MGERLQEHVSARFARLLALYRKPDGSNWGGQDLEKATGGVVTRSYVTNLKRGRIEHPGMDKPAALAAAMGFPPALWFENEEDFADEALLAALRDGTTRSILAEVLKMDPPDRELLLDVARGISLSSEPSDKIGDRRGRSSR